MNTFVASLILCLVASAVRAEDSFLGVSFGARALALGSAYSAVADDAQAVLWNPAGLAQLRRISLSGSQNHLSFTENVFAMTLNVPTLRWGTFALSVQELSIDNIFDPAQQRPVLDANGNPVLDPTTNEPLVEFGGFGEERDGTLLLGYGVAVTPWWLLGGAGKFLVGKSGSVLGTGFGANVGLLFMLPKAVRVGLVAEDLGQTIVRWEDDVHTVMTPTGRVGVAWQSWFAWLFSAEVRSFLQRADIVTAFGSEWRFADFLIFRVGMEDFRMTGGAGFRMPLGGAATYVSADYAFVTGSRFEDRNRLTITVGF